MKVSSFVIIASLCVLSGVGSADLLEDEFRNPPPETRPGCYWYWYNDNVSKEGITKDLEAMARVGIGRAYIGHIFYQPRRETDTPVGGVPVFSDAWWEAVQWAVKEADRCGVEIGFFNAPGWSQSGGPWIAPSQSMRYLASSETVMTGGKRIEQQIPVPEIKTFPYYGGRWPKQDGDPFTEKEFQDVRVIAFRQPDSESMDLDMKRVDVSSPGIKSLNKLLDGSSQTYVEMDQHQQVIDFVLHGSAPVQTLILNPSRHQSAVHQYVVHVVIERSEDGKVFEEILQHAEERGHQGPKNRDPILIPFPATQAKHIRVRLSSSQKGRFFSGIALSCRASLSYYARKQFAESCPSPRPPWDTYHWKSQPTPAAETTVDSEQVLDLTDKMDANGRLIWDAPEGQWVVMRCGMVPIGTRCTPASPQGRGLEVDKMNRDHVRSHFVDGMVGDFLRRTPAIERKALKYVIADSYETGPQNWTDGLAAKFQERFGYSPVRFLPCLTGRVVDSPEVSTRFLWDLRRLVAESVAADYVGGLREVANQHGLKLWLENYGHFGFPSEFLLYGKYTDQVGGEFWETNDPFVNVECRAAASCSHIYGRSDVYAEAFTSRRIFQQSPASFKNRCDWAYGTGINHLILHVYMHQPEKTPPGIISWFGTAFHRHNTWFEQSKAFIDYTRRCSVMLKSGVPVIDVAYYIGENTPSMEGPRDPELPDGYDFDYINSDVLINHASVRHGKIMIKDGPAYSVLVLPKQTVMRPEVAEAIKRIVRDGATVIGPKSETSPSLENYPNCDKTVATLANELWGHVDGKEAKIQQYGKGFVCDGIGIEKVFAQNSLDPDVLVIRDSKLLCAAAGAGKISIGEEGGIVFKHRKRSDGDVYFLANTSDKPVDFKASLRVGKGTPSLWNAVTGKINANTAFTQKHGRTLIPLHLEASESTFVVFDGKRGKNARATATSNTPDYTRIASLDGNWIVRFHGQGAPKKVRFDKLLDWSKHADDAIKHYAGTGTYETSFTLSRTDAEKEIVLELGEVHVIATVAVNGKEVGTVWTTPWDIDITDVVTHGKNHLQIRVANTWNNRLIADAKLPPEERRSYVSQSYRFEEDEPLARGGLLGPVRIKTGRTK